MRAQHRVLDAAIDNAAVLDCIQPAAIQVRAIRRCVGAACDDLGQLVRVAERDRLFVESLIRRLAQQSAACVVCKARRPAVEVGFRHDLTKHIRLHN